MKSRSASSSYSYPERSTSNLPSLDSPVALSVSSGSISVYTTRQVPSGILSASQSIAKSSYQTIHAESPLKPKPSFHADFLRNAFLRVVRGALRAMRPLVERLLALPLEASYSSSSSSSRS